MSGFGCFQVRDQCSLHLVSAASRHFSSQNVSAYIAHLPLPSPIPGQSRGVLGCPSPLTQLSCGSSVPSGPDPSGPFLELYAAPWWLRVYDCYLRTFFYGSVISQEAAQPSEGELGRRDLEGMYSAEEPFWATLEGARYLTAGDSDRVVCPFCSSLMLNHAPIFDAQPVHGRAWPLATPHVISTELLLIN
jgi:hypothetical protein